MGKQGGNCAWSTAAFDATAGGAIRIFHAGVNDSTQGPVLFDEEAARLVMAKFQARGVEGMIDLEHLSLDDSSPNFDPDARGAYTLELRRDANGGPECWAVPKLNDDGTRRVQAKTQRFFSPFFAWKPTEDGQRRVTEIRNIGLVADPATYDAQPLIAASARQTSGLGPALRWSMADGFQITAENLPAILQAAGAPADMALGDFIAALQATAMAAAGQPQPTAETPPEPAAEMAAEPAADPAKPEEDKPAVMAATARLMRLADRGTFSQALDEVEKWRQSHMKLEEGEKKLAAERAAMEATERRTLAGELVELGAELPATVWANPTAAVGSLKLSARILSEPIAELRARAAAWRAARPKGPAVKPPTDDSAGALALTAREAAMCAELKIDPKVYAADKVTRLARKAG